jgi:outer membrane receptor protein involved in Fe transport
VTGDYSLREALERALRGTRSEAVFYDRMTVRIVARPEKRPVPKADPAAPVTPVPADRQDDIIVTASKQSFPLNRYPGAIKVIDFDPDWLAGNGAKGTTALTETLPTLNSTNLGRGRNKLYVRGIADSSFNGPTQATVGQYLGDVRLNYSAPDPDLYLYDFKGLEVLAGPQGTLYGAGSLGGVVRLIPNAPDSERFGATGSSGISSTRFGGIGGDIAAMINVPLFKGRAALRYVGYATREAGYIDDPSRKLRDINSSRVTGQRLAMRFNDLAGWTIDIGAVTQDIGSDDGQYTLRGDPPLVRNSALSQPFQNDYDLVYLTAKRRLFGQDFTSTTSAVWHNLLSVFDATAFDGSQVPQRFKEANNITFISHETRLSGGGLRKPWVAGLSGIYNVNQLSRSLGPLDAPKQFVGVHNRQLEFSLFGQASRPISSALTATVGGRLTLADGAGRLLDADSIDVELSTQPRIRFAATTALDWQITPAFSTYLNYQQGFRPGGFAISQASTGTQGQEFKSDDLSQVELGIRWNSKDEDTLSIRFALFAVDWNQIQADLIDNSGLPNTVNIGGGKIQGVDSEINWRLSPSIMLTASVFFNESYLDGTPAGSGTMDPTTLPNIPQKGARLSAQWRTTLARNVLLTGNASLRVVGKSGLGAGLQSTVSQGNYVVAGLGARIDAGGFGVSLDITNLGDARSNTFAFGNPFGLNRQDQVTPLRPRTIRLGLDKRF